MANALAKIDAKTIAAYVDRWKNPNQVAVVNTRRKVFIDTNTLVRRHPAWKLADELERGMVSPSDPRIARILLTGTPANLGANTTSPSENNLSTRVLPATLISTRPNSSRVASRSSALDRFLAQSAARDARRASDEAALSLRALEDATELARRAAVAELDLPALSPQEALELLNLRLQLLARLSRTPAERAATREEIRAIEARYAALLQIQTDKQAARLRAATVDVPAKLRQEGLEKIARVTQLAAQRQAQLRTAIVAENRAQEQRDLALRKSLRLALPPSRRLRFSTGFEPLSNVTDAPRELFETAPSVAPSKALLAAKTLAVSRDRVLLTNRLRNQAQRDAEQWARSGAVQLGAHWSQNHDAPDRTAQVLKIVFPGEVQQIAPQLYMR